VYSKIGCIPNSKPAQKDAMVRESQPAMDAAIILVDDVIAEFPLINL
jgi:hypothetical protein